LLLFYTAILDEKEKTPYQGGVGVAKNLFLGT